MKFLENVDNGTTVITSILKTCNFWNTHFYRYVSDNITIISAIYNVYDRNIKIYYIKHVQASHARFRQVPSQIFIYLFFLIYYCLFILNI